MRTPGPIDLFARFRNNSTAFYLGTCIEAPEPEGEEFKIEVQNDLGGRHAAFQRVQDGGEDTIPLVMNRFDYSVVQAIRALGSGIPPAVPPAPGVVGSETGLARGTLVIGVNDFQLVMVFSYSGTPSAGSFGPPGSDLPGGRLYFSCCLEKYKETTKGTRVLDVALLVRTNNVFQGGSGPGPTPAQRGFLRFFESPPGSLAGLGSFAARS